MELNFRVKFPTYFLRSKQNHVQYFENIPQKCLGKILKRKWKACSLEMKVVLLRKPVHFYGNDGFCLFKYFVRTDDARRSRQLSDLDEELMGDTVVWTMLAVNLFCFIIITCCYIVIILKTKQPSQRSWPNENQERQKKSNSKQNHDHHCHGFSLLGTLHSNLCFAQSCIY